MRTIADTLDETVFEGWTHSILLTPEFVIDSVVPLYKQLAFAIAAAIQNGQIKKGYLMPSMADYASLNNISSTTVIKAYKLLKNQGLIRLGQSRRYWVTGESGPELMR